MGHRIGCSYQWVVHARSYTSSYSVIKQKKSRKSRYMEERYLRLCISNAPHYKTITAIDFQHVNIRRYRRVGDPIVSLALRNPVHLPASYRTDTA